MDNRLVNDFPVCVSPHRLLRFFNLLVLKCFHLKCLSIAWRLAQILQLALSHVPLVLVRNLAILEWIQWASLVADVVAIVLLLAVHEAILLDSIQHYGS